MKIHGRLIGSDLVQLMLRNVAERVPDKARKTLRRGAEVIEREAKLNTPVDTHALERSIHLETSYGLRGRLQIDILCGGYVDGVNVDEYALMVHENYEAHKPGAGTIAKRLANPGRYIGSHFLLRAYESQRDKLQADMIEAVRQGIAESMR